MINIIYIIKEESDEAEERRQREDDYCTIRRDMIGEGIMERKDGIYIRKV